MTTFVLRVAGERDGSLRGTVSHAATGETRAFSETAQLLSFLQEWSAAAEIRATASQWRSLEGPGARRDLDRALSDPGHPGPENP